MTTISTQEARTHLARYLAEVEQGREYVIARGKKAVAKLVPMKPVKQKSGVIKPVAAGKPAAVKSAKLTPRPKVGYIEGPPFVFPDSAFGLNVATPSGAKLMPIEPSKRKPRPKVGETMDAPFDIPASAFAPMTETELKEWGL